MLSAVLEKRKGILFVVLTAKNIFDEQGYLKLKFMHISI